MDTVKEKLIPNDYLPVPSSEGDEAAWSESSFEPKRSRRLSNREAVLLHAAFAVSYVVLITLLVSGLWSKHPYRGPGLIYTPAREAIRYEVAEPYRLLPYKYHTDPFFGDPSPELDQRWIERLKYATVRLTEDEFHHYDQEGIPLSDGSGYLATPTVYHDLHCLRALHKSLYPDYYFPGEDISAATEHGKHWRHCLHNLALSAMCNADMTMRVMRWVPEIQLPSPIDHEHECVNWDAIEDWARDRYVNMSTPGLVVHP